MPPPDAVRRRCSICTRETFADEDGPALCGDCWVERGDLVTERETGDAIVVYPFGGDPDRDLDDRPRYSFPYSGLAVRDEMLVE